MFARLIYYSYFIVVVAIIVAKWKKTPDEMQLLRHGSLEGYLVLGELALLLVMGCLIVVALRRNGASRREGCRLQQKTAIRDSSFRDTLRRISVDSHAAFARHPVWTSIAFLIMVSIPVAIVAFVHGGGLRTFGVAEWILVGVAELPIAYPISVTLVNIWSNRNGTR